MMNPTHAEQVINPKELAAAQDDKAPLDYLEHAADVQISRALAGGAFTPTGKLSGAAKYGRRNFRYSPIKANVYIGAIKRHIGALANGEDIDPDSGLSHWAHIGADIHVVLSAMDAGTYEDDRD